MKESDYPALYQAADGAAKNAQSHFWLALVLYLLCLISAAMCSYIDMKADWFYLAQGFILLGSLSISIYLAYFKPQRAWYAARALAESVKTVTWRYMMMAEPFEQSESRDQFVRTLRKILETNRQAGAVSVESSSSDQITVMMEELRRDSRDNRKLAYLEGRISDQFDWYKREARKNKNKGRVWFGLLIGSNAIAVIFAFSQMLVATATLPTEFMLALAGAGMTWVQARRYQELSASYALTAHEISFIKTDLASIDDDISLSHFIGDAENAFSREHTQWQARKDDII